MGVHSSAAETSAATFLDEVIAATPGGERLRGCLNCGSCGGSCPNGADMEHTPRALFTMIALGDREHVLSANTMWACVSCYLCTARCPREIPITDLMYTLKRMAVAEELASNAEAVGLARNFNHFIERYGRSFEFGLATRFYLKHKPGSLLKSTTLGFNMLRHGRLHLTPTKIREIDQLRAILDKARELGNGAGSHQGDAA